MSRDRDRPPLFRVVLPACGVIAAAFGGSTLLSPLYAHYQARFGFSAITLTLVYAAYVVGNLAALLFFGRLSDHVGRRPVVFASLLLCAASAVIFMTAPHTGALFAGRVTSGLAVGLGSSAGTAWLVDLHEERQRPRAALIALESNLAGIGGAPLIAGVLAAWSAHPLLFSFGAYLTGVIAALVAVWAAEETMRDRRPPGLALLRPKLALPASVRAGFIAPAVTSFAAFAFVGYYSALLPTLLRQSMGLASPAVGGAILAEMFVVAMIVMAATRRLSSRAAMLTGLALLIPAVALVAVAQPLHLLAVLLVGTVFGGAALALGYRGSLEIVNAIAPEDRRAAVVSVYFIACFVGNSVPVIGIGVATVLLGGPVAGGVFAGVIVVMALGAFATGLRYAPRGAN